MTARGREGRWRAALVPLATVAGMALTAALGLWQLDRAAQKRALQQAMSARVPLPELDGASLAADPTAAAGQFHRRVRLRGHWRVEGLVLLDNRQMRGRPGFYVLQPLQIAGRPEAVVVQRGWLPRDPQERTRLPPIEIPTGEVEVRGRIAPPPARLYEFDAAASGAIRQNLSLPSFARELNTALLPLSVLQLDAPGRDEPFGRDWPLPAAEIHKHYGYAAQWFGLCGLIAGLFLWFRFLRPRDDAAS